MWPWTSDFTSLSPSFHSYKMGNRSLRVLSQLMYVEWYAWAYWATDAQGSSFSCIHSQGLSLVLLSAPQTHSLWSDCLWPDQEAGQGQYPPRSWRQDANRREQRIFHGSTVNEELTLFEASIILSPSSPSPRFPSLIFTLEFFPGLQELSMGKWKTI